MFKILIVEDEKNLSFLLSRHLTSEGYDVVLASDGEIGLDLVYKNHIDLIIADLMMPNMDGITMIKVLRENDIHIPVLIISAKDTLLDKKQGFLSGADDYMVKPIEFEELGFRVAALLKRSKAVYERKLRIKDVELDFNSLSVNSGDISIKLPKKEFLLLFKLMTQPGTLFTRRQLIDEIWGYDKESSERTVDVHIKRIRRRLVAIKRIWIDTVHGIGYKGIINEED